jgi:curved DNA-binding protein CbpA
MSSSSSSTQPDLYAVLGVEPAATGEQIKHAYRTLLRRHHPDTRPTSPDIQDQAPAEDTRLQQVIHAYAVLHDPRRRASYDHARRPSPPQPPDPRHRATPPRPAPVVIGTISQPPGWLVPLDARPTGPTVPNELAPGDLLTLLLRELFDWPR